MRPIRTHNSVSCWIQPPDAENRMSGGVGEVTGAIPLPRPDRLVNCTQHTFLYHWTSNLDKELAKLNSVVPQLVEINQDMITLLIYLAIFF
jgi:hypothetical protein